MSVDPKLMAARFPSGFYSPSSHAQAARVLIAQYAQSLEPFMNAAAADMKSLPVEERVSHGQWFEEQAPGMPYAGLAVQGELDGSP
jgi:hypothetical protein